MISVQFPKIYIVICIKTTLKIMTNKTNIVILVKTSIVQYGKNYFKSIQILCTKPIFQ